MSFDRSLTLLDRAIIAEYLSTPKKDRRGRPTPTGLPHAVLCLSFMLEYHHEYSKEGARIARIAELTGRHENGIRNLLKRNSDWMVENTRLLFSNETIGESLVEYVFQELKKNGHSIEPANLLQ